MTQHILLFKSLALNSLIDKMFFFFTADWLFPDTNTHTHSLDKLYRLFIAQSHDRKHIVSYLLGLVACSACIVASFCVEAAVQAFMNELSLRQRPGDGIDPTVMSLQRQGEERELYETSHSFVCPLPLCQPPPVLYFCDGFILQQAGCLPLQPHPHPQGNSHPPEMLPSLTSLALPCPALLAPAPVDSGPSRKKNPNFTLTLRHTGREGC